MQVNITDLIEKLETNPNVEVMFKTKVGTTRTMNCTRFTNVPGGNLPKINGPSIIAVFDLLIKEWRAFRKDAVISYQVVG